MQWLQNRGIQWMLIVVSLITTIVGVLFIGNIVEKLFRLILNLNTYTIADFLIPVIVALTMMIIGTIILVLAFQIQNTKMKVSLLVITFGLSMVLEIIDIVIRFMIVLNEALLTI